MSIARLQHELDTRRAEADREQKRVELRIEGEPGPDVELTLADDCAVLLEAWFQRMAYRARAVVLDSEVRHLAERMRALGRKP